MVPTTSSGATSGACAAGKRALLAVLCVTFTLFHLFVLNVYSARAAAVPRHPRGLGRRARLHPVRLFTAQVGARRALVRLDPGGASVACGAYITVELDGLLFRAGAQWTTLDPRRLRRHAAGARVRPPHFRPGDGDHRRRVSCFYASSASGCPGCCSTAAIRSARWFAYLYSNFGMFGVTTQVSSTYIIMFMCFAAFLGVSKVGDYINHLSIAMFGWARGGPAKAASPRAPCSARCAGSRSPTSSRRAW